MVGAYREESGSDEEPLLVDEAPPRKKRSTLFAVCPFILG
jgi:hypothetical protein